MNVIQQIEAEHAAQLPGAKMPLFQPGDTVIVNVKVAEGERTRVQAYEGVCIARSGHGLNENFTVRKISYGEGVERVFPVYSPMIDSVKVVRRGKVRRAKLYYLRDRRGKSARIAERVDAPGSKAAAAKAPPRNKPDANPRVANTQGRRRSRRLFCLSLHDERTIGTRPRRRVFARSSTCWRRSRSTPPTAIARPPASSSNPAPSCACRSALASRPASSGPRAPPAATISSPSPRCSTGRRSVRRCATSSIGRRAGHWRRAACCCAWRSAPARSPSRPRRSSALSRPASSRRA